ncbi:MAG: hypothetical protein J0L92_07120 [Deltaproteobacteria bacterium]|nr:hypothetical protein [Deltaproteobacteria bacterium]
MCASTIRALALSLLCVSLSACGPETPPVDLPIFVSEGSRAPIDAFVSFLPEQIDAGVRAANDPIAAMTASTEGTTRIALVVEPARCEGCFRLERTAAGFVVRGDAPLGIQYGLAALLEGMGVRFLHPQRTFVPTTLADPDASIFDRDEEPEVALRGLQLHILHPIEPYWDVWEPSEENLEESEQMLHWLVVNRANYVTWPGLEDIQINPERREAVLAHQRAIVEHAHLRGLRVGLGIQIFGRSNLQKAYDLVDTGDDPAVAIPANLELLGSVPYDAINLAFGEFFAADNDAFIHAVELAYDSVQAVWPGALVTGTVHVGNFEDTRITYEGQEMLYYFLVQYAERPIRPWVHTVMYYGLWGDAGGAYNHDEFDEHRAFLLERLNAGEDVGYHPETAYWVAFDINVPTYLPLYIRARWDDLDRIRDARTTTDLEDHIVFSSGWEWGYWQNDWAVLRMSWRSPERYEDLVHDMLAPLPDGPAAADAITALADVQQDALIDHHLAAYLAGQDATFELGYSLGFWSQPRRPSIAELHAMTTEERATFSTEVVDRLATLAADTRAILLDVEDLPGVATDPFLAELRDGIAIDVARAEYAHALWSAVVQSSEGGDATAMEAAFAAALADAEAIVARRHAALFDPDPDELLGDRLRNGLLYDYGYLRDADLLCFWNRERIQYAREFQGAMTGVPACVL